MALAGDPGEAPPNSRATPHICIGAEIWEEKQGFPHCHSNVGGILGQVLRYQKLYVSKVGNLVPGPVLCPINVGIDRYLEDTPVSGPGGVGHYIQNGGPTPGLDPRVGLIGNHYFHASPTLA